MSFEIKNTKEAPIPLVKKILSKRLEDDGEAPEVIIRTLNYAEKFTKCDENRIEELLGKLIEMGFNEITASMIASICPTTVEELRVLLVFESKTWEREELEKVVELLKNYTVAEQL